MPNEIYFHLIWLFVIVITLLMLFLSYLYFSKKRAQYNEHMSLAFSRDIIKGMESEKQRISKELHDTVAQDLWRLSFQIENKEIANEQRAIIQKIRNICDSLVPPDFKRRGLINALESLCYNFEKSTGIECKIKIQENLTLDSMNIDKQLQCFRIAQECLANIEKHSNASEASVLVYKNSKEALVICVCDNGIGFSAPNRDSCERFRSRGHIGFWGMYERAASINGILTAEGEKGEGVMITLQIPLGDA